MTRPTIICVDDERSILKCLGIQLRRHFGKTYNIELASSGEEALELCAELTSQKQDLPLIISDQKMAGMGGDAFLIQLHTLYPKTLKIMLTGQADVASVGNVVNQAALYRYIPKPWDETDLILTVTEALRRFQQDQLLSEQNQQLKVVNAQLENSLSLLVATLEATADGILVLDKAGTIENCNQKFLNILDLEGSALAYCKDELMDLILSRFVEEDAITFQRLCTQVNAERNNLLKLKNGNVIEYYWQPYKLADGVLGTVLSFRDVTVSYQTTETIRYQALHDALTNLPNRVAFTQKLTATLTTPTNGSKIFSVMFLDLDHFKEVNDTLGHAMGDFLLQNVVQRLKSCLREFDMLARWGGDEFVLLLPHIRRRKDATEIASRLVAVLQPDFLLESHRVNITASIGIALHPYDGADCNTLLHHADVALYQAKRVGRNNYQYYSDLVAAKLKCSASNRFSQPLDLMYSQSG